MVWWTQFKLNLWKSWLVRKRNPVLWLLEVFFPVFIFVSLITFHTLLGPSKEPTCLYRSRGLPSAGTLAFLQSNVCNVRNKCSNDFADVPVFNESKLPFVVENVGPIVNDNDVFKGVEKVPSVLRVVDGVAITFDSPRWERIFNNDVRVGENFTTLESMSAIMTELADGDFRVSKAFFEATFDLEKLNDTRPDLLTKQLLMDTDTMIREGYIVLPTWTEDEELSERLVFAIVALAAENDAFLDEFLLVNEFLAFLYNAKEEITLDKIAKNSGFDSSFQLLPIFLTLNKAIEAIREKHWERILLLQTEIQEVIEANQNSTIFGVAGEVLCGDREALLINTDLENLLPSKDDQDDEEDDDSSGSGGEEEDEEEEDTCANFRRVVRNGVSGGLLWQLTAPLLQGRLIYTPANNKVVEDIIDQAKRTYELVAGYKERAIPYLDVVVHLDQLLENQDTLDIWAKLMHSKLAREALANALSVDADALDILEDVDLNQIVEDIRNASEAMSAFRLIRDMVDCYVIDDRFEAVESEQKLEERALAHARNTSFMAGLVFMDVDEYTAETLDEFSRNDDFEEEIEGPKHIKYKIRMPQDTVPSTKALRDSLWIPGPDADYLHDLRYSRGFVQVQEMIDQAIIRVQKSKLGLDEDFEQFGVYTQQFPYPCYEHDRFLNGLYLAQMLQLCLFLSFAMTLASSIRFQIWEKESQNLQVMRVMGMRHRIVWIIWLLVSFITLFIIVCILTILLKGFGLLPETHWSLVFILLGFYAVAILAYSFLMAAILERATLGATVAVFVYILSIVPFAVMVSADNNGGAVSIGQGVQLWQKIVAFLSMSSSFSYAALYMTRYEQQQLGLQWSSVWSSPLGPEDAASFGLALAFVGLDALIMFAAAILVLAFKGSFWADSDKKSKLMSIVRKLRKVGKKSHVYGVSATEHTGHNESMERHVGVKLSHVSKVYNENSSMEKVVVDNLSLNFNKGEITGFLGHNGAGKSTTIKMMTGQEGLSSGHISILGHDVGSEWSSIQSQIGLCPQQSILYPDLTVREHLYFYAVCKDAIARNNGNKEGKKSVEESVNEFLRATGLVSVGDRYAKNLSGGMKRRLCVGLAFVGDSSVVILDEPTTGVDPMARRDIWRLIKNNKSNRTIIVTTHHLDEAESLCDRLAVIHRGRLLAQGSVGDIRNRFGNGYHLLLLDNDQEEERVELIKEIVPQAKELDRNAYQERRFLISNFDSNHQMIRLIKELENRNNNDGSNDSSLVVNNFTLERTNMEQIFMALVNNADETDSASPVDTADAAGIERQLSSFKERRRCTSTSDSGVVEDEQSNENSNKVKLVTGIPLLFYQLRGMLLKRYIHSKRSWRVPIMSFLLPLLLMTFCFFLANLRPQSARPPLRLEPNIYGPHANSFVRMDREQNLSLILEQLFSEPGLSTACMDDTWNNTIDNELFPPQKCQGESEFQKDFEGPGSLISECQCERDPRSVWTCENPTKDSSIGKWNMSSSDVVFDLSNSQIDTNQWILNTYFDFIDERFGGWSVASPSLELASVQGTTNNLVVWYNNKAFHSLPIHLNALHNALLRRSVSKKADESQYGITGYSHPIPVTTGQVSLQTIEQRVTDYFVVLLVLVALSFVLANFGPFLIAERVSAEKHVIIIGGVRPWLYWLTAFIWDFSTAMVFVASSLGLVWLFNVESFTSRQNFSAIATLLTLYFLNAVLLVHCIEKLFKDPGVGQLVLLCGNIVLCLLLELATLILIMFSHYDWAQMLLDAIIPFLVLFPSYALGHGLLELTTNHILTELFAPLGLDVYIDPFSWDGLLLNMIVLFVEAIIFLAINAILENRLFGLLSSKRTSMDPKHFEDEDEDVHEERLRVNSLLDSIQMGSNVLTMHELSRHFGSVFGVTKAVDGVTVGIRRSECFGYLGLNGAGKTTSFKMLTNEIMPSSGHFRLRESTRIGYCPQVDALDAYLTVKEQMLVQALLQGIVNRKEITEEALGDAGLVKYKSVRCNHLSGGNKRKLCTIIAMLSRPELILMDEPTSGMDAVAKRLVWKLIRREVNRGSAVILTSHSMEECENLCNRLAIMAKGKLRCLGTPNRLKNKFGKGFTLHIDFKENEDANENENESNSAASIVSELEGRLGKLVELDVSESNLRCRLEQVRSLSAIYEAIIDLGLDPERTEVHETTLDDVFVNLGERAEKEGLEGGKQPEEVTELRDLRLRRGASVDE